MFKINNNYTHFRALNVRYVGSRFAQPVNTSALNSALQQKYNLRADESNWWNGIYSCSFKEGHKEYTVH